MSAFSAEPPIPPIRPPSREAKVLRESNGYVLVEGKDFTADLLGDLPHLIDVRNQVLTERQVKEQEIEGVMFNGQKSGFFVHVSPNRTPAGSTFVSMSNVESSTAALEYSRSTYTTLSDNRGYIQHKPCGQRHGASLPFKLSVPVKEFDERTGEFEKGTDFAQLFIEEVRSDVPGAISKHITDRWEAVGGMLSSGARGELMNGLRFAQIYKQVYGEYPTTQLPVSVHKITDIYMPDKTIIPIATALKERFENYPFEFSMLKTKLIYHERERLKQKGFNKERVIKSLEELKKELDALPPDAVTQRFLDEDPFVQVTYHTPSFVRLSYEKILAHAQDYKIIRKVAGGEAATPKSILDKAIHFHETVVEELAYIAGHDALQIKYPDISTYHAEDDASVQKAVESWRLDVSRLNQELFKDIANIETIKMARSTAVINAVGGELYESLWRSNMIGGSPCDWDWFASDYMEYLPQPQTPREFDRAKFLSRLEEQNEGIRDNISSICYLLGIEQREELEKTYTENYLTNYALARKTLVESTDSDLDPQYKQSLLTKSPQPQESTGSDILFV